MTSDNSLGKSLRQVLAENLKLFMRGMTPTSLARAADISRGQVNNILKQNSATTIDALERLARAINVQPAMLIFQKTGLKISATEFLEHLENRAKEESEEKAMIGDWCTCP